MQNLTWYNYNMEENSDVDWNFNGMFDQLRFNNLFLSDNNITSTIYCKFLDIKIHDVQIVFFNNAGIASVDDVDIGEIEIMLSLN